MVFIPPPHLATPSRPSYAETYTQILTNHRRSPLTSASSVIILVAPDVDALCAARMLADLFKQDDVMHRIVPVSGTSELETVRDELLAYTELHTLILLNMGSVLDLSSPEWFGEFNLKLNIHVIDSSRPQNLGSLFGASESAQRIIFWDDGSAEDLVEQRKSYEIMQYVPEPDSDDESEVDFSENEEEQEDDDGEDYDDGTGTPSGKRRSLGDGARSPGKRRKIDREQRPQRMARDELAAHFARVHKYYSAGTSYGQSSSGTIYILATVLERVDNDLLWLAILGLTYQYTTSRISRVAYEKYHSIYYDEVFRLNPPPPQNANASAINPDDLSVRATEELRFMLFRHWTLYDAMYHSSYVAGKLGIWKERGRKRLTGLLAKMGFSIPQTQQPYSHMDIDLKSSLRSKLEAIAPEYGLLELSYPSFTRCFGYRSPPLSAADAVEAVSALLDVAGGVRMEVEVEGARNGGEWFGGGRVWEVEGRKGVVRDVLGDSDGDRARKRVTEGDEVDGADIEKIVDVPWWQKNFWTAFDALSDIVPLREALHLSMSLHRAIIRQGTSIIDKQDIKSMRSHRVVVLTQGPDLTLFAHPGVLSRLALWLVDALRDRLPGTVVSGRKTKGKKSLPFVVACLDERKNTYMVVGVMAALDFGDVRKNEFGLAFLHAQEECSARSKLVTFDTSVVEIDQADLKLFLETLNDNAESY